MKQFLAFHRHNIMVPYPVFGDERTLLSGTADIVATCIYFTHHTIIGEAVGSAACVRLADLGCFAAAHTGTPSHPNVIGPSRPVNWDSELPPPPPPPDGIGRSGTRSPRPRDCCYDFILRSLSFVPIFIYTARTHHRPRSR